MSYRQPVHVAKGHSMSVTIGDTIGTTVHNTSATAGTGLRNGLPAGDATKTLVGIKVVSHLDACYYAHGANPVATAGSEVMFPLLAGQVFETHDPREAASFRIVGSSASSRISYQLYYGEA